MITVADAYAQLQAKQPAISEARRFGPGGTRVVSSDARVRAVFGPDGKRFRFNLSAVPITAMAARMTVDGWTAASQAPLDALVQDCALLRHAPEHTLNMLTYGDSYLLGWPGDQSPVVQVCSPMNTFCAYSEEDDHEPEMAIRAWKDRDGSIRAALYTPTDVEHYRSTDGGLSWSPFVPEGQADAVIPHSVGRVPIWHARTSLPYGAPEHREAWVAQLMVDKAVAAHASSVDFHGNPQAYALYDAARADGTSELGNLAREDYTVGSEIEPGSPEEVTGIRRDPGSIWGLTATSVGQLQASSATEFLTTIAGYSEWIALLTGTPSGAFTRRSGQLPSGEAQRSEDAPFRDKIATRQAALAESWDGCLTAVHGPDVTTNWRRQSIDGDAAFWAGVRARQDAGVPVAQTLIEAGYAPEDAARYAQTGAGPDVVRAVGVLDTLADAIQKLGTAQELGVVDVATVRTLVSTMLGTAVTGGAE